MTLVSCNTANAQAARFEMEPFSVVAFQELAAFPMVEHGVCMNPLCSKQFNTSRSWQHYCSAACRKLDEMEMRRIGQKAAPALLAWRMGKYEKTDADLRALSRAGRNYISQLSSEWFKDRVQRAADRSGR